MKKGFTLIELLIVITIIGILAVVVIPNTFNAPAKARDTARKADVLSITKAIELGRADGLSAPNSSNCAPIVLGAFKKYMPNGVVPKDPNVTNPGFDDYCQTLGDYIYVDYSSSSEGFKYGVFARLENRVGNVECADFTGGPTELNATNGDCWGVMSK